MPDTTTDELSRLFAELLGVLRVKFVDGPFSPWPTEIRREFGNDLDALKVRLERLRERVST